MTSFKNPGSNESLVEDWFRFQISDFSVCTEFTVMVIKLAEKYYHE